MAASAWLISSCRSRAMRRQRSSCIRTRRRKVSWRPLLSCPISWRRRRFSSVGAKSSAAACNHVRSEGVSECPAGKTTQRAAGKPRSAGRGIHSSPWFNPLGPAVKRISETCGKGLSNTSGGSHSRVTQLPSSWCLNKAIAWALRAARREASRGARCSFKADEGMFQGIEGCEEGSTSFMGRFRSLY